MFEPGIDQPVEVGDGAGNEVSQAAFEAGPYAFRGVELGGIGGQLVDAKPGPGGDQLAHQGRFVSAQVVPHQHDRGASTRDVQIYLSRAVRG